MKIGPREQIIVAGVAVVVVIVAVVAFLVWPQFQRNGELEGQIAKAKTEVESSKALLATREASKDRAAETDARWLRLANLMPEGPDLPSLIVELQDVAFASGVQLVGVTPADPAAGATYYTIPIQVQVIGTWADTVDFLQRIMKLNRGVRIVESATTRTDNSEQAARENETIPDYAEKTTIKLESYMMPASTGGTATPAPTATPTP
jgi:type IV pilus assembly protein PilO